MIKIDSINYYFYSLTVSRLFLALSIRAIHRTRDKKRQFPDYDAYQAFLQAQQQEVEFQKNFNHLVIFQSYQ